MLGHSTVRKHLHFGGHKGPVKKAYVHRASKGSNPLGILFYVGTLPHVGRGSSVGIATVWAAIAQSV